MRYQMSLSDGAKRALRLLPKEYRQEIGFKLFLMQENLTSDVKKLKGSQNEYRLRVGNYRVKFRLEGSMISVYTIGDRKDIYK